MAVVNTVITNNFNLELYIFRILYERYTYQIQLICMQHIHKDFRICFASQNKEKNYINICLEMFCG